MNFGFAVDNWRSSVGSPHTRGDGEIALTALNGLPPLPARRIYRMTAVTNPGLSSETVLGVFEATGLAEGPTFIGVTAAAGYTDVDLAPGVTLQIRVCAATIDEIQTKLAGARSNGDPSIDVVQITTNATGSNTPASMGIRVSSTLFGSVVNPSMTIGYNMGVNVPRINPDEPGFGWQWEGDYWEAETGKRLCEGYVEFWPVGAGTAVRPIFLRLDRSATDPTQALDLAMYLGNPLMIGAADGSVVAAFNKGGLVIYPGQAGPGAIEIHSDPSAGTAFSLDHKGVSNVFQIFTTDTNTQLVATNTLFFNANVVIFQANDNDIRFLGTGGSTLALFTPEGIGLPGYNWSVTTDTDPNWGMQLYNSGSTYQIRIGYTAAPGSGVDRRAGFYDNSGGGGWIAWADADQNFNARGTIAAGSGPTGSRPPATVGAMWYDATLRKPVWFDGSAWRDAAGAVV